jgi:hypothetical protein
MDAVALPVVIAWAEAQVAEFDLKPSVWWGFPFEMVEGATGFAAQQRLHGFCGFAVEDLSSVGADVSDEALPAVISIEHTSPTQLHPYVSEIRAAYLAHVRKLGLSATGG